MRKLTPLLFIAGLFVIGLTQTQCGRKDPGITPLPGGDTQTTSTKVDSSGEDVHVIVYQNTITTGAPVAQGAEVYLLKNFTDYTSYINNGSLSSKYIDSASQGSDGTWTFHKVKPPTGTDYPGTSGSAYVGDTYTYYLLAKWNNSGTIETGWYSTDGNPKDPDNPHIQINNGLGNKGLSASVAVIP